MYMNNLFSVGLVIKVMFLSMLIERNMLMLIFASLYFSVYKFLGKKFLCKLGT